MRPLLACLIVFAPLTAQVSVKWEHTYEEALSRAKAENKPIFVDLWAEWCGPCQYLKNTVFPEAQVQAALMGYVPLSALVQQKDGTPLAHGTRLAQQFGLNAFPTLIILDTKGNEVRRHTGAFRSGAELASWLK